MSQKRVLVVDDELNIRRILQVAFDKIGFQTEVAASGPEALELLTNSTFDAVLTDVTMPGMSGYQLLKSVKESHPETPVVIMTAYGTIPQAIQAIRDGAFEYVTKPFDLEALKKVVTASMTSKDTSHRKQPSKTKADGDPFLAVSPAMRAVLDLVRQVGDSKATVMIGGESGVGKEVVAKALHQVSSRRKMPFVALSCAAIPETLLEAELFGHEKGAFTGAQSAKAGRFETANNGTLFLDEVGEIPMATQVKLLRVLQEREFERLGASRPTKVDVRVITATHRNLYEAVEKGAFRLDLLYRMQVVEIHVPPLRERSEDIVPLAELFLQRHAQENARPALNLTPEATQMLWDYNWPGNVRELENVMERATVLALEGCDQLTATLLPRVFHHRAA